MIDPLHLGALQSQISAVLPMLDKGGYAHNIISSCLRLIAEHHGKDAANEAIRDFGLDKKGWSEE